jgi:hypothetical protein
MGTALPPGRFPILIKFLFTTEKLSVQVHPEDDHAWKHHQQPGKTEMWYVLAAEPGCGDRPGFCAGDHRSRTAAHFSRRGRPSRSSPGGQPPAGQYRLHPGRHRPRHRRRPRHLRDSTELRCHLPSCGTTAGPANSTSNLRSPSSTGAPPPARRRQRATCSPNVPTSPRSGTVRMGPPSGHSDPGAVSSAGGYPRHRAAQLGRGDWRNCAPDRPGWRPPLLAADVPFDGTEELEILRVWVPSR